MICPYCGRETEPQLRYHEKGDCDMDLDEYQRKVMHTAIYPGRNTMEGLKYTVLGLCGEVGELANKFKKVLRDDDGKLTEKKTEQLKKELGGVQWYVAAVAWELDCLLSQIAEDNLEELAGRKERGTLGGSGDDR